MVGIATIAIDEELETLSDMWAQSQRHHTIGGDRHTKKGFKRSTIFFERTRQGEQKNTIGTFLKDNFGKTSERRVRAHRGFFKRINIISAKLIELLASTQFNTPKCVIFYMNCRNIDFVVDDVLLSCLLLAFGGLFSLVGTNISPKLS